MRPVQSFVDRQYFLNSIPFYGKGSNYVTNQSGFNGGISIKFAALKDMSFPEIHNETDFDRLIQYFQGFRLGSRVQGVKINTGYNAKNKAEKIIGKLRNIKINRKEKTVQVFITDPKTGQISEIYSNSLSPLTESHVKTFDQFIVLD